MDLRKWTALIAIGTILLVLLLRKSLLATFYILQGEQTRVKAIRMRGEASEDERKRLYQKSCDEFLKAYDYDRARFDYIKSDTAHESCIWVMDFEAADKFRELREKLPKKEVAGNRRWRRVRLRGMP